MGEPWGLSGPQFLSLYMWGFVVALVVMVVVQSALTRLGTTLGADDVRLDTYQVAYLARGYRRVVDTALAGLAVRDQVLVARNGRIISAAGASGDGPVELAVLEALRRTGTRSGVYKALRGDYAMRAVEEQVRSRGLLLDGTRALLWWLAWLLPIAVWVVGVVRMINGINLDRPVSNLVTLLMITLLPLAWVLTARRGARRRPTPLGRAVLRRLRRQHRTAEREPAMAQQWQLAGVAVLGFAAIEDPSLRSALIASSGASGSSGSGGSGCGGGVSQSGGGSGCGGGSSCGGGGGCGGGCGG